MNAEALTTDDCRVTFYRAILPIIIYVAVIHKSGHCGMSMLWTKKYLLMELGFFSVPIVNLNDKRDILWTDFIHLTDSSCYNHEPLNFDYRSEIIKPKQYIALLHWKYIITTCSTLGIVPPIISTLTDNKLSKHTPEIRLNNKAF